jgi:hypothetical protein
MCEEKRVDPLGGFGKGQRIERYAENVGFHTSENTLPIFSRMSRSADVS